MAATSDDDVPTRATATGSDESDDGDTTAATTAPATHVPALGDEEDERTVQQTVDPVVRTATSPAPPPAAPLTPPRITSKKPTALGLGSPLPVTRPAAGYDPSAAPAPSTVPAKTEPDPPPLLETQADADDESITATSPAPRLGLGSAALPLTMPGIVQIREMPEDEGEDPLDETEVRTVVTAPPSTEPATGPPPTVPLPAAGRPPPPSTSAAMSTQTEADELDDSVTTQAPTTVKHARLPEDEERPPVRAPQPIPAAGRKPGEELSTLQGQIHSTEDDEDDDAYASDESVTTRGPAVEYVDDSVTTQAPLARAPKAALAQLDALPSVVPADEEGESITTQAPSHLTNMLRVIATPEDALEDEEPPENKTAVMLNAPVKPVNATQSGALRAVRPMITAGASGAVRAAAIADLREPTSDSGLRIARAEAPSGDHANLNALMAGGPRELADLRALHDPSAMAFANTEQAFHHPQSPRGQQPSLREVDFGGAVTKPRYGLLVGLVAVVSFAIPLGLFLWLQSGSSDDAPPRTTTEVLPSPVKRDDPIRGRTPKAGASSSSTAAPHGGNRPPWFPRRR